MDISPEKSLDTAARIAAESKSLVILTGAGVSAESGIPTFRGENGLWKNYRPEELATPEAFRNHPALVWEWYNFRKNLISEKSPNPAHYAITELQHLLPDVSLITQNVDSLHNVAGTINLIEMHGNIFRARCTNCGKTMEYRRTEDNSPVCSFCYGALRPDIVWFGEMLDPVIVSKIESVLYHADTMIIAGTSGAVYPAAGYTDYLLRRNKTVIEINTEKSGREAEKYLMLTGKAGDIFPELSRKIKSIKEKEV